MCGTRECFTQLRTDPVLSGLIVVAAFPCNDQRYDSSFERHQLAGTLNRLTCVCVCVCAIGSTALPTMVRSSQLFLADPGSFAVCRALQQPNNTSDSMASTSCDDHTDANAKHYSWFGPRDDEIVLTPPAWGIVVVPWGTELAKSLFPLGTAFAMRVVTYVPQTYPSRLQQQQRCTDLGSLSLSLSLEIRHNSMYRPAYLPAVRDIWSYLYRVAIVDMISIPVLENEQQTVAWVAGQPWSIVGLFPDNEPTKSTTLEWLTAHGSRAPLTNRSLAMCTARESFDELVSELSLNWGFGREFSAATITNRKLIVAACRVTSLCESVRERLTSASTHQYA